MRENGEEPLNVDNIAKSVLNDFTAPKPEKGCNLPGCSAEALKRCGGCKSALYCSSAHQKEDWPSHKEFCRKAKDAPAKSANAGRGPGEYTE